MKKYPGSECDMVTRYKLNFVESEGILESKKAFIPKRELHINKDSVLGFMSQNPGRFLSFKFPESRTNFQENRSWLHLSWK